MSTEHPNIVIIGEKDGFTEFIEVNSGFIITFTGMIGSCIAYLLVYFLKSRCTRIDCLCFKCERQPINEEMINDININRSMNNV